MGWVISFKPRPPLPPEKTRYPLYRRLGGFQGRSGRVGKISPPKIPGPSFPQRDAIPTRLSRPVKLSMGLTKFCRKILLNILRKKCIILRIRNQLDLQGFMKTHYSAFVSNSNTQYLYVSMKGSHKYKLVIIFFPSFISLSRPTSLYYFMQFRNISCSIFTN
jgi:hypothetical protein